MLPNVKVPRGLPRAVSLGPTARRVRSWSRAPAARAGTPNTTCSRGLSVRSYGRFAESVTRLAAGRVKRGLPYALRNCGYQDLQPLLLVRRLSRRPRVSRPPPESSISSTPSSCAPGRPIPTSSSTTTPHEVIAEERDNGPVFVFVYLAANHFPWNYHYRPDLFPDWSNPENPSEVDEYLRRQEMSVHDYARVQGTPWPRVSRRAVFVVRFGDHQPLFAKQFLEPPRSIERRWRSTSNSAIPVFHHLLRDRRSELPARSTAHPRLIRSMRPIFRWWCWKGRGCRSIPPSRSKRRSSSAAAACSISAASGAEARRFNRLLIDAGLIQGF